MDFSLNQEQQDLLKLIFEDTPFLGGLTLGQYRALSGEEKASIWAEAERDFVYPEEKEIRADAVPAR